MVVILQRKIKQFVKLYLSVLSFIIKKVIEASKLVLFTEMLKKQIQTLFNIYYFMSPGK